MSLIEQITNDLTSAMKSNDKFALGVYRMLKSALQMEQINKKHDLSDEEVIAVLKRQVKLRKDSIVEYEKYSRNDLVSSLQQEIELILKYLPEEMDEKAILSEIEKVFLELQPTSIKDMGSVMKLLTQRIGSSADMSLVSSIVKNKLM